VLVRSRCLLRRLRRPVSGCTIFGGTSGPRCTTTRTRTRCTGCAWRWSNRARGLRTSWCTTRPRGRTTSLVATRARTSTSSRGWTTFGSSNSRGPRPPTSCARRSSCCAGGSSTRCASRRRRAASRCSRCASCSSRCATRRATARAGIAADSLTTASQNWLLPTFLPGR